MSTRTAGAPKFRSGSYSSPRNPRAASTRWRTRDNERHPVTVRRMVEVRA